MFVQVGLKGESMSLHSLSGSSTVEWGEPVQKQPLTWYKVMKKLLILAPIIKECLSLH